MTQKLKEEIIATAIYYGRDLNPQVLGMMVDDLSDLDASACIQAYRSYRRNPKNRTFPLPAQIREIVAPDQHIDAEALAREVAARIVGAVTKFGWPNGRAAREFIGEEGWRIVELQGGWSHICENLGVTIPPSTFQAQVRDQLAANFRYGADAIDRRITDGSVPTQRVGELERPSLTGRREE